MRPGPNKSFQGATPRNEDSGRSNSRFDDGETRTANRPEQMMAGLSLLTGHGRVITVGRSLRRGKGRLLPLPHVAFDTTTSLPSIICGSRPWRGTLSSTQRQRNAAAWV